MSHENVELHRHGVDAVNSRAIDEFLEIASDDIVAASRLVVMEGSYRGHEGIRRWWRDFFEFLPDYRIELLEIRDLGDATIAHIRGFGHGSATETPVDDRYWQVCRWRDGKCTYWSNFPTEAEALEVVGQRD
jgi:ketosteroid isomerase-like protein